MIEKTGAGFAVFDPAYLMMSSVADSSANDMAMGNALRVLTQLGKDTGCTICLVAHNRKGRLQHQKKFDPPELAEIAHAGYAAWARWFVLLSTRKDFDSDIGQHWLHMRTLGSAGHSGLSGARRVRGEAIRRWRPSLECRCSNLGGRATGGRRRARAGGERTTATQGRRRRFEAPQGSQEVHRWRDGA
ncbi:MAG: hypothetical protein QM775_27830 [Pirellulales bacterium]